MLTVRITGYVRAVDRDGYIRLRDANDATSPLVFDGRVESGMEAAIRGLVDGLPVTVVREPSGGWRVAE